VYGVKLLAELAVCLRELLFCAHTPGTSLPSPAWSAQRRAEGSCHPRALSLAPKPGYRTPRRHRTKTRSSSSS